MAQKHKSVKYKVITGYLLLFIFAVVSVWFIYTEISKAAIPGITKEDNKKIIQISNTIADLYTSEALGRSSILTGSQEEYNKYTQSIDSIHSELEKIKKNAEESQVAKFDSIQMLIRRKKKSITDIIEYRKIYNPGDVYSDAINSVSSVKDSVRSNTKPVRAVRKYQWSELVNEFLTPQLADSLSTLDVSNDSLSMAFDKALTTLLARDIKMRNQLYRKEQVLLEENRILSDKLRIILSSVENEILKNSYDKINRSQAAMSTTLDKMAWIGAAALLVLIVFAWIIISDLTKNQNYRLQLERLNTENQELLRSKTMLMATVTHDLQTPLGSIIGFSDLLSNTDITGKQQQYLGNIKESADYILKLVNDLMDFSKLENNRISIEEVNFNFRNIIENTCLTLEHAAENKNIELNWQIDAELDNNFLSDPYRIKQVLTNLVSNAIKFTHKGSVKVKAHIIGDTINITVKDTGIGIGKENQENVFKEFTQAHSGIEKKFGGTGLGLTISKRMIELLGGTIQLESEEGQGSKFIILLPCKHGEKTITEIEPEDIISYPFLRNKKILAVDDDNTQLTLLKEILSSYGTTVKTAINSSDVPSLLEKENFDLVLTDIQMPIMDGFELLKKIKEKTQLASLPIIALSGRKDLNETDFIEKGFTAYHPKPINKDKLLVLLSNIFGDDKLYSRIEINRNNNGSYNLRSLGQFTNNDKNSLKAIIDTFITSSYDNCKSLKRAAGNKNEQEISETAHRMIPMLKQLEAYPIVDILDPLEDKKYSGNWVKINREVSIACDEIEILLNSLKTEVN